MIQCLLAVTRENFQLIMYSDDQNHVSAESFIVEHPSLKRFWKEFYKKVELPFTYAPELGSHDKNFNRIYNAFLVLILMSSVWCFVCIFCRLFEAYDFSQSLLTNVSYYNIFQVWIRAPLDFVSKSSFRGLFCSIYLCYSLT